MIDDCAYNRQFSGYLFRNVLTDHVAMKALSQYVSFERDYEGTNPLRSLRTQS